MAEYEPKIKRILDTYVTSGDMVEITGQVDIFDKVKFENILEKVEGNAAKADTIAYNTRRTIYDKFDEDPVFFRKFSEMLEDAIRDFREQRLNDAQYLEKVREIAERIVKKDSENLPDKLKGNSTAAAIFRVVNEVVKKAGINGVNAVQ
jgi:type I restriction enzyme R subunit